MTTLRRNLAGTRRTRRLAPALLASAVLMLSGCAGGTAPNQAFTIGEVGYPLSELNDVTSALCGTQEYSSQQAEALPMASLRANVASRLAMAEMMEQLADENGVTPTSGYARQVSSIKAQALNLPEDLREQYVYAQGRIALLNDLVPAVGEKVLTDEGVKNPTPEESQQRGVDLLMTYGDTHQVTLNPTLGMDFADGQFSLTDQSASVAVSDFAKARSDYASTQGLQPSLVCG